MVKLVISTCIVFILLFSILPQPVLANHQMSFSTDRAAYIRGQGNVILTLQDADNDGAFVGWDGIAIYDVVGIEVANFDDNTVGQGHPIQAGKNLVWDWDQKYNVRAGKQNANNNGQLVPLGNYQAKAITQKFNGANQKTYSSNWFKIDVDTDGDGLADSVDGCASVPEDGNQPKPNDGCPDTDKDGVPDDQEAPGCEGKKETQNGFLDSDGCPDVSPSQAKESWGQVANGAAVAGDILLIVATGIVGVSTGGVGFLAIAGEVIGGAAFHMGASNFVKDPPDTINYKELFIPNLQPPKSLLNVQPKNQIESTFKAWDLDAFFVWKNIEATTKSMERHDGALLNKDYKYANMQAAAVRKYAVETRDYFLKASESTERLAQAFDGEPKSDFPISTLKNMQNTVAQEGLPEEEIEFAKSIGFSDTELQILEDMFLSVDTSKMPDMHPSKYLRDFVPHLSDFYAGIFDYLSQTYGTNLYISPSEAAVKDGLLDYGIYYDFVPNDARNFIFTVDYGDNLNYVGFSTEKRIFAFKSPFQNKILVFGLLKDSIKYGSGGQIMKLQFKPESAGLQKYKLAIDGTYFDMQDWLGAPNINDFCEIEPNNMVCNG